MIKLRSLSTDKATEFTLLAATTYTVGRKEADLEFPQDQAVSRNHCELYVDHPTANLADPTLQPTIVVKDVGSKFGTFVIQGMDVKSKLAMREDFNLFEGGRVRFGLNQDKIFQFNYTPLVVSHYLDGEELIEVKKAVQKLGGHVVKEWMPECTYFVTSKISYNLNLTCALLAGKEIVTPAFFKDWLGACRKNMKSDLVKLPVAADYLPPVQESLGVEIESRFHPNLERNELFKDKVFLFISKKQIKKFKVVVELGGGNCQLLPSVSKFDLHMEKYNLVKPTDVDVGSLEGHLKELADIYLKKKRLISPGELLMAALYVTCEKQCNPFHVPGTEEVIDAENIVTATERVKDEKPRVKSEQDVKPDVKVKTEADIKLKQEVKAEPKLEPESVKRECSNATNGEPDIKRKRD